MSTPLSSASRPPYVSHSQTRIAASTGQPDAIDPERTVASVHRRPDVTGFHMVHSNGFEHRVDPPADLERILDAVDPARALQPAHVGIEAEADRTSSACRNNAPLRRRSCCNESRATRRQLSPRSIDDSAVDPDLAGLGKAIVRRILTVSSGFRRDVPAHDKP